MGQDVAEGAHLALLLVGRGEESLALRVRQVKAFSGRIEQIAGHLFSIDRL